MSVILTLMRTNASMIEVNVCNSASAMSPRSVCKIKRTPLSFFLRKSGQVVTAAPMKSSLGPWLPLRQIGSRLFACCVLLRTRRFSAVWSGLTSRVVVEIGWEGESERVSKAMGCHIRIDQVRFIFYFVFCWCYGIAITIFFNLIFILNISRVWPNCDIPKLTFNVLFKSLHVVAVSFQQPRYPAA